MTTQADAQTLDGRYEERQTAREAEVLTAAIEQALSTLSGLEQQRWRARLEEMTRAPRRLRIAREGTQLVVQAGEQTALRSARTGAVTELPGNWQLDQRIVDNVLVQRINGNNVRQTLRYSLSADGNTLTVQSRLECADWAGPIAFRVTYARRS